MLPPLALPLQALHSPQPGARQQSRPLALPPQLEQLLVLSLLVGLLQFGLQSQEVLMLPVLSLLMQVPLAMQTQVRSEQPPPTKKQLLAALVVPQLLVLALLVLSPLLLLLALQLQTELSLLPPTPLVQPGDSAALLELRVQVQGLPVPQTLLALLAAPRLQGPEVLLQPLVLMKQ
jgi:hypothetical protein